ncbi:MAG: CPBP family intramembrane glutamic endopeptidase [Candidatus Hodarchaeales archaeon]|jgi:membrane protease YdiL (CAAX protease family)
MTEILESWKMIIRTPDFIIGTLFLFLLFLMFILQGAGLTAGQFIFGLFLLFLLGGFFMYIFTPPLIRLGRDLLTTTSRRLLPPLGACVVFSVYRLTNPTSLDLFITIFQIIACIILVLIPSLLYSFFPNQTKNGLSLIDVIAGLWVWMPIEFGIIDDFIGSVELGQLPFETLLMLFAFLYSLIFVRQYDMGLTFSITLDDLIAVCKAILVLLVIITPLGILSNFLAPPNVILDNAITLVLNIPGSLITAILTFILIFIGTALIEEMLFRGFIYNLLAERFKEDQVQSAWWYGGAIALVSLIIITPWVDDILQVLSQLIPAFSPLRDVIGSMADPLGEAEGQAWPLVQNIPLELMYVVVAIILGIAAVIMMYKTRDPIIAALVLSSILFGWAHFEDVRYILLASIAGLAYGWTYWKTQKIVPAAMVHMLVNGIWGILFSL